MKQTNGSRTREAGGAVRLAFAVSPSPEADRTFDVVCCTSGINNHDARVDNTSWRLDRFLANPICLFGHAWEPNLLENVRPADTLPIGKASNVRVEGDSLMASITFAPASVNPFAEQVYQAFAGGYLNAVSVGFLPHSISYEMVDDVEIAVLSDCELYEISVVPVPADAGAVAVRNSTSLHAFASKARSPMTLRKQAAEAPMNDKPAAPTEDPKAEPTADKPVEQAAEITCPECGFMCDPTFKFCPMCGESLLEDQADQTEEQASPPPPPADGEPGDKTLQGITGQRSRTQALGVVHAWKLAAEAVPALQARVAELEGVKATDERTALIEKLTAEKKLTPAMKGWAQSTPIAQLKAFAAVAAPVAALSNRRVEPQTSTQKRWEELSNMERHSLYEQDREAFEALRADHQARSGH